MAPPDIEESEITKLLEAMFRQYGYDFRQYSEAHVKRRIMNRMAFAGIKSADEMLDQLQHDQKFASQLLQDLSITVTEMFRDPGFYKSVREKVIPILKTYSFIKIWHAGCSTGEEAYSMAIILKEEGLYERARIYATDFNQHAINRAREGIFTNDQVKEYTSNYQRAGGRESFSDYYTSKYNMAIMDQSLKKNIVWAHHNLVTDSVFAEVNLVLCRNVLIYFNRELQDRVLELFFESLMNGGILCMGTKESLRFSNYCDRYSELDKQQKIFKKKY
jgi:chemotaxis protein methyltransferase CheR